MNFGRTPNILFHVAEDIYHLAPVPLVYHRVIDDDREKWHGDLIREARQAMTDALLDVPDVRHVEDLGSVPEFDDATWSEQQITPVGVWHRVPTNNYLDIQVAPVQRLRALIESRYLNVLTALGFGANHEPWISESWIQFYKNGDYKVLHNHERYGPPYPNNRWVGAYYLDAGNPDASMPYAGVFSFAIRGSRYFIRPEAGLLILWPADILHDVHPFYGSRERVVINFNINTR